MKLEPFDRVREGGVDAPRSSLEEVLERLGRGKPKTEEFDNHNHTPTSAHPNAVGMPAAGDHAGALKFAMSVFNVKTSGGIRAEVDDVDAGPASGKGGPAIWVSGSFYEGKAPGGKEIGHFERTFDGYGKVTHNLLEIDPSHQSQGIASEFNAHAEKMYKAVGIREIHLEASKEVGGYAWAVAGFDWESGTVPFNIADQIRHIATYPAGNNMGHNLKDTVLGRTPGLAQRLLTHEVQGEFAAVGRRLSKGEQVAPYEIAAIGKGDANATEKMWAGKALLLGNHWFGVKRLDVQPKVSVNTDEAKAADRARLASIMKTAKA